MKTLKESLKIVNEHRGDSNEAQLKMWATLRTIEDGEFWKKPAFYLGAPEYRKYADASFDKLLKNVYGCSMPWFKSIKRILKLKGGKALLIKHGRANMVTYLNSTEKEREAILNKAEQCVSSRTFASIKAHLFPAPQKKKSKGYRAKYEALMKEHAKILKENTKLSEEQARALKDIEKLKEAIAILSVRNAA